MRVRIDEVRSPAEVLANNVFCCQGQLVTVRLHRCNVSTFISSVKYGVGISYEVVVVTPVEIGRQVNAVLDESEVGTHVELVLLLIGKRCVTELHVHTRLLKRRLRAPWILALKDRQGIGYGRAVTC